MFGQKWTVIFITSTGILQEFGANFKFIPSKSNFVGLCVFLHVFFFANLAFTSKNKRLSR